MAWGMPLCLLRVGDMSVSVCVHVYLHICIYIYTYMYVYGFFQRSSPLTQSESIKTLRKGPSPPNLQKQPNGMLANILCPKGSRYQIIKDLGTKSHGL